MISAIQPALVYVFRSAKPRRAALDGGKSRKNKSHSSKDDGQRGKDRNAGIENLAKPPEQSGVKDSLEFSLRGLSLIRTGLVSTYFDRR